MKKLKLILLSLTVGLTVAAGLIFFINFEAFFEVDGPKPTDNVVGEVSPTPSADVTATPDNIPSVAPSPSETILPAPEYSSEPLVDAYKVIIDGEVVGIVPEADDVDDIVNELLEVYKQNENVTDATVSFLNEITITKTQTFSHNITNEAEIENTIADCVVFKLNAYKLTVDGILLGYFSSQKECDDVITSAKNKFKSRYFAGKTVTSIELDATVNIEKVETEKESIDDTSASDAVDMLLSTRSVEKVFSVSTADQLKKYYDTKNITTDRNRAEATLENDNHVTLFCEERLTNFIVKVKTSKVTSIPYTTTTRANNSLSYKVTKVVRNGVNGSTTQYYEETYMNGEHESTVATTKKTVKAVSKIVEYGTKVTSGTRVTAKTGLGTFYWPCGGQILGQFAHYNGKGHTGVDIAAVRGTPIYAVAAGKVTKVGYDNYWGYYVQIEHDSTYSSLIMHMNALASVKVGQKVSKGQQIGVVGSTGNATGPHCHLSILKNGKYIDPTTVLYGYYQQ